MSNPFEYGCNPFTGEPTQVVSVAAAIRRRLKAIEKEA